MSTAFLHLNGHLGRCTARRRRHRRLNQRFALLDDVDGDHLGRSGPNGPFVVNRVLRNLEGIARLTQAGYRIVVATNQSGIARGLFDTRTLLTIHETLLRALTLVGGRIDAFFFCPHAADAGCPCRKPQPGMLLEVARRFNHLYGREPGFEEKAKAAVKKMGTKKARLLNEVRTKFLEQGDTVALARGQAVLDERRRAEEELAEAAGRHEQATAALYRLRSAVERVEREREQVVDRHEQRRYQAAGHDFVILKATEDGGFTVDARLPIRGQSR